MSEDKEEWTIEELRMSSWDVAMNVLTFLRRLIDFLIVTYPDEEKRDFLGDYWANAWLGFTFLLKELEPREDSRHG